MKINEISSIALSHLKKGNLKEAEYFYQEILKNQSDNVTALHFIGVIHYQLKNYDASIEYMKKALQFAPDYADAYNNLGIALQETGRLDEAMSCYQKALHIIPNFDRASYNLGTALEEKWLSDEAVQYYQKALQINPHLVEALNNLGHIMQDQGKLEEAEKYFRQALEINPDFASCHSNLLLLLNYNPRYDIQTIFSEHLRFQERLAKPFSSSILSHPNTRSPERRLRIGYVSPDFRRHSVNYFIEPVLAEHHHDQFEIFCFSDVLNPDTATERLQGYADHWRNIAGKSDEETARLIREDGIDILIDLAGHTGYNRMLVFARKPAPVQVTWIGYPPTTGLSTIDYKIVDNFTNPSRDADKFYTEQLIRLPECFVLYMPDKHSPAVSTLPALSTGHITFGSFNNFAKITPEVATTWSKILYAVPDSHLVMKWKSFSDKATRQYITSIFSQKGVAADRIILQSSEPSPKHLETYNSVDIGLDTFPFNGLTTTCEALWMGVPVITMAGYGYASRAGVSILSNIGMSALIAETYDEYVSIAIDLAKDIKQLQVLRDRLRGIMLHSPLMNTKQFTLNLENLYRKMWQTWCKAR